MVSAPDRGAVVETNRSDDERRRREMAEAMDLDALIHGVGPGSVIADRYKLVRQIGEGGWGVVYEAEHLRLGHKVAVKVLRDFVAFDAEAVARFHREAQAVTAIAHPNIVQVIDFGDLPDGAPFMVLEHLEGTDWGAVLEREGPQPLDAVARVLVDVCRALSAAHAKGIVHRDLKPANIFLTAHGVKVLDFGISKFAGPSDSYLTQSGKMIGTPRYMSPEQCEARRDIDHRSDIFALGVLLYRALAGRVPFDAESHVAVVSKIVSAEPEPLAKLRPNLPNDVAALAHRMLAKNRDDRPQSCREIELALTKHTRARRRSSAPMWIVIGAAATFASVGGAIAGLTWMGDPQPAAPAERARERPAPAEPAPRAPIARPATVHIEIITVPAHAELSVCGAAVANPYAADRSSATPACFVTAFLAGYRPVTQSLTFDASRRMVIELERDVTRPSSL
jgi:hypothetical protein